MRDLAPEISASNNERKGVKPRILWWVRARNRVTNEIETIGFWNGDDHQTFVIDGETRTYFGAGNILGYGDMTFESALHIRTFTVNTAYVTPEIELALRGYETRFARTELHLAFYNTETNNLLAPPVRVFKGWINKLKIKTPKVNEMGSATVDLVGHTRLLTKKLASKRSDQNQTRRQAGDRFFKDVSMTGTVQVAWGEKMTGAYGNFSGPFPNEPLNQFYNAFR